MFESCKRFLNIPRHVNVRFSVRVIPLDGESNVFCCFFVYCHWVVFLTALIKCSAPLLFTYLTAKSLMTSVKHIGLVLCYQKPFMILFWWYPYSASLFSRSSWAMIPACGKPYMPCVISQYMYPSCVTNDINFYSLMISSGMSVILSHMYSDLLIGVCR